MSAGKILKPIDVTLCDICNEEIPTNATKEDKVTMLGYSNTTTKLSPTTKWAIFKWSKADNKEWTHENRYRAYDFHGRCALDALESVMKAKAAERANDFNNIVPEV